MATRATSADTCRLPGCMRPRYKEPYGITHDFCGRTHADLYKRTYLTPPITSLYTRPSYGSAPSYSSRITQSTSGHTSSKPKPLKAIHNSIKSRFSNEIKFYNRDEPCYEFTNFYPVQIKIDGKYWPTSEHYFQAQKFVGTPYVEIIRNLPTPREAFQLSRDPAVSQWRRSDWDRVKDDIMLKALRCKFDQNDQLRSKLIDTGDKTLIEHTHNDSYWGDGGGGGKGLNKLGLLLMEVRKDLRAVYGRPSVSSRKTSSPLKRSNSFSISSSRSKHKHTDAPLPQDDSSIPPRPTVTFAPRLSRSSSLSNLTSSSSTVTKTRLSPQELGYDVKKHHSGSSKQGTTVAGAGINGYSSYRYSSSPTGGRYTGSSAQSKSTVGAGSSGQPKSQPALPNRSTSPTSRNLSRSSTRSNDSSNIYLVFNRNTK